jgi:predicted  nucleic acid-binding Zn-ribbon protein
MLFICTACGHEWELSPLSSVQDRCPGCGREKVRRIDAGISQQGFRNNRSYWNAARMMGCPGNGRHP